GVDRAALAGALVADPFRQVYDRRGVQPPQLRRRVVAHGVGCDVRERPEHPRPRRAAERTQHDRRVARRNVDGFGAHQQVRQSAVHAGCRLGEDIGRIVGGGGLVAQRALEAPAIGWQQPEAAIAVGAVQALERIEQPGAVGQPHGRAVVAQVEREPAGRAAGEGLARPGLRSGRRSAVPAAREDERETDDGIHRAHGSGGIVRGKGVTRNRSLGYRCGVSPELRVLRPGDETALDTFLARHADSSMFLRSNARAAGLVDRGQPGQGTYVAAVEQGAIVGVAAHCWNGMMLVQAPAHAATLAREAVRLSGRTVAGFSGPWDQVVAARQALGLGEGTARKDSREDLYSLELRHLAVPPPLAAGQGRCRHPEDAELELMAQWRIAFTVEALGATATPALETASRG